MGAFAQGSPQGQAQSDDADMEMRIQRLESQLRQLTGQNEELQYRNRQLEDRLRQLGAAPPAPGGQPAAAQRGRGAAPGSARPAAGAAGYPQQGYPQQVASRAIRRPNPATTSSRSCLPAPIVQDPAAPPAGGRRRGDAFDPPQNPNAPGAPRALGSGADARCPAKRPPALSALAVRLTTGISAVRAIPVAPCRRPLEPHRHRAAQGPAQAPR